MDATTYRTVQSGEDLCAKWDRLMLVRLERRTGLGWKLVTGSRRWEGWLEGRRRWGNFSCRRERVQATGEGSEGRTSVIPIEEVDPGREVEV